jgi:prevent-host-death family protein
MPAIRPSADLRNHYNEISEFCQKSAEPVFITKNGRGDLAVLSIPAYEALSGRKELYGLIQEGLDAEEAGETLPSDQVFTGLRREFGR